MGSFLNLFNQKASAEATAKTKFTDGIAKLVVLQTPIALLAQQQQQHSSGKHVVDRLDMAHHTKNKLALERLRRKTSSSHSSTSNSLALLEQNHFASSAAIYRHLPHDIQASIGIWMTDKHSSRMSDNAPEDPVPMPKPPNDGDPDWFDV